MAELVDARDLKSRKLLACAGSIPATRTMENKLNTIVWYAYLSYVYKLHGQVPVHDGWIPLSIINRYKAQGAVNKLNVRA
jgi:hypothetical protein